MAVWQRIVLAAAVAAAASGSPQYGAPPVSSGSQGQSYGAPQGTSAGQGFSNGGSFGTSTAGNFGGRFVSPSGGNAGFNPVDEFAGEGMPYNFDWAVREPDFSNDFQHQEESDGVVTSGQYRVNLPDGRVQIVTYTVEGDSGFQASVTYEGEAQYPPAGSSQGNGGNFNQGNGGNFINQGNRYNPQGGSSASQGQGSQFGGNVEPRPSTSYGAF